MAEPARVNPVALRDAAKQGPGGDARRVHPRLYGFDGPEAIAPGDRHLLPLARLIRLAAPDDDPQTVLGLGPIIDPERRDLGASERASEREREQRPVPLASACPPGTARSSW